MCRIKSICNIAVAAIAALYFQAWGASTDLVINGRVWKESDLLKLPQVTLEEAVFWDPQAAKQKWSGPVLSQVVGDVPANSSVIVQAHNNFTGEIPLKVYRHCPAILARYRNGKPLASKDKGNWIIIWDTIRCPEQAMHANEQMWVWFVSRISVAVQP